LSVIVQLVALPQAPLPFASDTSGQCDQFQSRRIREEGWLPVVKREKGDGQGGVFLFPRRWGLDSPWLFTISLFTRSR
jgi:hypothetical protein